MKKKKKRTRVTKKDISIHRKLVRRSGEQSQSVSGIRFDRERYLQAIANLKRKLLQIATDIGFLLANADNCIDREQDLNYAREHVVFARERLGDTEYTFTDSPVSPKRKLNRKKKKGKLNRRRAT